MRAVLGSGIAKLEAIVTSGHVEITSVGILNCNATVNILDRESCTDICLGKVAVGLILSESTQVNAACGDRVVTVINNCSCANSYKVCGEACADVADVACTESFI